MKKTKKILSVFLAVLMIVSTCTVSVFAESVEPHPLPNGYYALPTSPDGLAEGAYWFDMDALRGSITDWVNCLEANRTYYFNETTATITYEYVDSEGLNYGFLFEDTVDNSGYFSYLRIVGYDKLPRQLYVDTQGYVLDYSFESKEFSHDDSATGTPIYDPEYDVYSSAIYYLSADKNTIVAITKSGIETFDRATNQHNIFNYLKTNPVSSGSIPLPISAEGLKEGDYWLDLDGLCLVLFGPGLTDEMKESIFLYRYSWYLNVERSIIYGLSNNCVIDDYSDMMELVLRRVGYDFNGYVQLPFSPDGLPNGSKWFDMTAFLSETDAPQEVAELLPLSTVYYNDSEGRLKFELQGHLLLVSVDGNAMVYVKTYFNDTPSHEHIWDLDNGVVTPATCISKEMTTYHCTGCDEVKVVTTSSSTDPSNHVNTQYYPEVEATCQQHGWTEGVYCNDCQTWIQERLEIEGTHVDDNDDHICDLCGEVTISEHVHTPVTQTQPSTCKQQGFTLTRCSECNEVLSYELLPYAEHQYGEWEIEKSPTTTRPGLEKRVCKVCGHEDTREIPMLKVFTATDEDSGIIVSFGEGTYANEDITLIVEEEFTGSQYITASWEKSKSWNIKTYLNGTEVQPNQPVTVKIPLPAGYDPNNIAVYHVNTANDWPELITDVRVENGYIVFTATSFSVYIVVDESSKVQPQPQPDTTPKCPWCGGEHVGFFQGIVGFFHRIFAAIFGARF